MFFELFFTICDGNSIMVGNSVYNTTGSYTDTIQSSIGCDSIVHTNLTVLSNSIDTQHVDICNGESIVVGSSTYSIQGWYADMFTAINGCDSTLHTNLIVLPNASNNENIYLCSGDTLFVGSSFYLESRGVQQLFLPFCSSSCLSLLL